MKFVESSSPVVESDTGSHNPGCIQDNDSTRVTHACALRNTQHILNQGHPVAYLTLLAYILRIAAVAVVAASADFTSCVEHDSTCLRPPHSIPGEGFPAMQVRAYVRGSQWKSNPPCAVSTLIPPPVRPPRDAWNSTVALSTDSTSK